MGKIDDATKEFVKNTRVFADAFNFYLYGGRKVLEPESLTELDTNLLNVFPNGNTLKKSRDVSMAVNIMKHKGSSYMLLAIENQAKIHYAMPVRSFIYDALQYSNQVQKIVELNRSKGDFDNSDEFLSGFKKTDKLAPVITLVIYFGSDEWDGPRSLSEMFYEGAEEYKSFLPQYNLNLISPNELTDSDLSKFNSSLKQVLSFIKYSGDKGKLDKVLHDDTTFSKLGYIEAEVIKNCTGLNLEYEEEGEEIDMCKAVEDMRQESYEKGMELGVERGIEQGIAQGLSQGVTQGIHQSLVDSIKKIMKSLNYTATQAMNLLEVPVADREGILKELY